MKLYRIILFLLLLCLFFPVASNADQLEDANAAIKNEDYKKAGELLIPLAEENNAEAQTLLGALYINGEGVDKDINKGMALIMKAASLEYKPARIQAFKLCLELANKGGTGAMYNVGYMCLNGWDGEKYESDVCLSWIEKAARLGHNKSLRILADIYKNGRFGIAPDAEKAAYLDNLEKAFAAGIDGKWAGTIEVKNKEGDIIGPPIKISYEFKANGDDLAGTVFWFGGTKSDIEEGKIDGKNISFIVEQRVRGVGGMGRMKHTSQYTGIFMGDVLKLSTTAKMTNTKIGAVSPPPATFYVKRVE